MKKILFIASAILILLSGCENFLDSELLTEKTTANFPETEKDAQEMVTAIYAHLLLEVISERYWKVDTLQLPFCPQEARSFKKSSHLIPDMKDSLLITHPADTEGKYPQRCPRAKVEEPSARMMTEAMYFS